MERLTAFTTLKPIRIYCHWTCGDGCCSDSHTIELPSGEYTLESLAQALDVEDWVYEDHYWDWLKSTGGDERFMDWQYYDPSEDERDRED